MGTGWLEESGAAELRGQRIARVICADTENAKTHGQGSSPENGVIQALKCSRKGGGLSTGLIASEQSSLR